MRSISHPALALSIFTLSLPIAGLSAQAQAPAPSASVDVRIGPDLQKKAHDLGERELTDLTQDLSKTVQDSLKHAKGVTPVRVDLVLEDAVPNRPTFEQLGRTPGLSFRSHGLGGARVSGTVVYADGQVRPIKEQFFETDLRNEFGVDTWYDANRAFEQVAYDIRHGRLPTSFQGPGPSGSGHFGYPLTDQ
jgi:hypothetical protein